MSHRTRERPAECLASLSHSTMIAQHVASSHRVRPRQGEGRGGGCLLAEKETKTLALRRRKYGHCSRDASAGPGEVPTEPLIVNT
ncbi:hypothetical protein EVAR_2520_1 [Eumeta japonica]|uniref:Uncharacterized protein n=1 Tax=Eumeta variegata TaxID=151549 RepID=A0A4C1SNZ1_EUMVA|nr:hypothetical protein EVAR_2520_1 [Eumeta japonica]